MGDKSNIPWTDATWNCGIGCTKVSEGCKNCYAERVALDLQKKGNNKYKNGFQLTLFETPSIMEIPLRWKKPRKIFVNSMSDLFHEGIPLDYIQRVFKIMNKANWHTYQILTKRAERLYTDSPQLDWSPHIWQGVSVENQRYVDRIDFLRKTKAHVKFLSCEPLLGSLELDLDGIDWVIVGGESGTNFRPFKDDWAIDILKQCRENDVPFFFKQHSGKVTRHISKELRGRMYHEFPKGYENSIPNKKPSLEKFL